MSTPTAPLRILVTGAASQLGQSLRELAPHNPTLQFQFTDHRTLDISNRNAIEHWLDTHPTEIIINTAAYTAVDQAEDDLAVAMAINADAAGHLAELSTERGCRLLHLSTDYVFDGRQAAPYAETDTPRPLNVYGRSKLAGETLIGNLAPDALILRTSWVFSPYGNNFLKTMLRLGRERESLRVIDDQIGGPSYGLHIAEVLIALAQHSPREVPGGVVHFSGQPHVSWHTFVQTIFAEAVTLGLLPTAPITLPIPSHQWQARAQRPQNSRLDNRKLSALLGPLSCDWHTGVRDALAHLVPRSPEYVPPLQ